MTVLEMDPTHTRGGTPFRALVTLSHPSDRRTAEDALSRHGFNVRTTDDRRAATALLLTYSPDVVVIDAHDERSGRRGVERCLGRGDRVALPIARSTSASGHAGRT